MIDQCKYITCDDNLLGWAFSLSLEAIQHMQQDIGHYLDIYTDPQEV